MLSRIRQRAINGYHHIMACPIVRAWAVLVIMHFIVQVALQAVTLKDNQQAKAQTGLCISLANVPIGLPLLENDSLSLCNGIPGHHNVTCIFIASASAKNSSVSSALTTVNVKGFSNFDLDQNIVIRVGGQEHFVTGRCAVSLQFMFDAFRNDAAEDIATICFQFWLLIVSLLAILQDSIPHLAVCVASHLLDVAWAGFRIKSTIALREDYYSLIVDSACNGEDMLGNWWEQRLGHAAPLFGANVITLILLAALAVILFRRFAKINRCHMGASLSINKMYKIALAFSAFLQLAAFFTILAVGMWIDLLSCSLVADLDGNVRSDQAAFFVLAMIIAPWIISGWWAVFREVKWAFVLFSVLHAFLLSLWPGMLASAIFRYVLKNWAFFACVSVASYLFVVATAIMAVVCRLNFGRGLGHFLRVESDLNSSGFPASFFTNDPVEKDRSSSPESFDFGLMDPEKPRKGSFDSGDYKPMDIRPYTPKSSKYSLRSLSLETSSNYPESPIVVALPTARGVGSVTTRDLKRCTEKALPSLRTNPGSRPTTADKERSIIQPPPNAYLQDPYQGTRSRKETPSLLTQATGTSTNSCSHVVVSLARKDPVISATARTIAVNTISSGYTPPSGITATRYESRPSTNSSTKGRFHSQPDSRGGSGNRL